MRLICPNCDAQYEVPDDVMPTDGRDVQCSNCGQTWFQEHPDYPSDLPEAAPDDQEDEEIVRTEPHNAPQPDPEPDPEPAGLSTDVPTFEPEPTETPAEALAARRELDPTVAGVLRAEAELESQARQRDASTMESQPDLGLDETPDEERKRAQEARDRMARMRGEAPMPVDLDEEVPSAAAAVMGSRRDLLPDIEEINSTLRSNSDRSPASDPGQTAQIEVQEKRSSRRGFILTIALVSALAVLYSYAPQLIEAVPQAEGILNSYVAIVDNWRVWLDAKVSSLLNWLDAAAASSSQ